MLYAVLCVWLMLVVVVICDCEFVSATSTVVPLCRLVVHRHRPPLFCLPYMPQFTGKCGPFLVEMGEINPPKLLRRALLVGLRCLGMCRKTLLTFLLPLLVCIVRPPKI